MINRSSAWRSRPETPFRSRLQAQDFRSTSTYAIALLCGRCNRSDRHTAKPCNELPPCSFFDHLVGEREQPWAAPWAPMHNARDQTR
jgi:hypothetical protein